MCQGEGGAWAWRGIYIHGMLCRVPLLFRTRYDGRASDDYFVLSVAATTYTPPVVTFFRTFEHTTPPCFSTAISVLSHGEHRTGI